MFYYSDLLSSTHMNSQSNEGEGVGQDDAAHGRSDQGVQEADTTVVAGGEQPVELRTVGRRRVLPRVALAPINLVQVHQLPVPPVRLPWRNPQVPVRRLPPPQLVNPPRPPVIAVAQQQASAAPKQAQMPPEHVCGVSAGACARTTTGGHTCADESSCASGTTCQFTASTRQRRTTADSHRTIIDW
jgi:hypothetical protein